MCTPMREVLGQLHRLDPVMRRSAPTGSTHVPMWDVGSASPAGHAMSIISRLMKRFQVGRRNFEALPKFAISSHDLRLAETLRRRKGNVLLALFSVLFQM